MASNAENVSIWWSRHGLTEYPMCVCRCVAQICNPATPSAVGFHHQAKFIPWYLNYILSTLYTISLVHFLNRSANAPFYTPVWKTGRIMLWQCPSVCPSVRPSVRPRFPDFFSTCFEISIWNLVYTFSRWHDMSSLSCITIGSLWPSLQPKVGQTYFFQSWPHKSR